MVGFYSTYEELKRNCSFLKKYTESKFLQYLWGIETCYNCGQKLDWESVFTVPMRNWNLDIQVLDANIQSNVFTVPMRNWNLITTLFTLLLAWFLQYLWGIET